MGKQLILRVTDSIKLYRDPASGIAWVENGRAGVAHSCHPNVKLAPFVRNPYRGQATVTANGYCYAIDTCLCAGELDELARQHCRCGGNHERSMTW